MIPGRLIVAFTAIFMVAVTIAGMDAHLEIPHQAYRPPVRTPLTLTILDVSWTTVGCSVLASNASWKDPIGGSVFSLRASLVNPNQTAACTVLSVGLSPSTFRVTADPSPIPVPPNGVFALNLSVLPPPFAPPVSLRITLLTR